MPNGKVKVEGTLQAVTRKGYKDGQGEKRQTLVAVLNSDNPLYPIVVSVSKDQEQDFEDDLRALVGEEVSLEVFAGGFKSLWLVKIGA